MSSTTFNDPNYTKLFEIWQETETPDFVKEASIAGDQRFNTLPIDAFADPANRRYPLNNKSNTWLSREYFGKDRVDYPEKIAAEIEQRIHKAADFWNLDKPMRRKQGNPYAGIGHTIHINDSGDQEVFNITLTSPGHYKQAAETLYENRSKYTYPMRRSFARGLLAAPAGLKSELPEEVGDYLEKAANYGTCSSADARMLLFERICWTRRSAPRLAEPLTKIAHLINQEDGVVPIPRLHKIASALDLVDRCLGAHLRYGKDMPAPEERLFRITEKVASEIQEEAVALMNGHIVPKMLLKKQRDLVDEFFTKHLGEIPYQDDEEMVMVITSLPRSDADVLESFLDNGDQTTCG